MTQILQAQGLKPDAYITELDRSQVADVTNFDPKATFFYGIASKGIVGRPVRITNPRDLVSIFGEPNVQGGANATGSMGLWCAYRHLASGAGEIWFQRVVNTASSNANAPQAIRVAFDGTTYDPATDVTVEKIATDVQAIKSNDASDTGFYLYSNDPIYKVDFASLYKNIGIVIRKLDTEQGHLDNTVVGGNVVESDYNSYLSNIVGKSTVGTYKWAIVEVWDTTNSTTSTSVVGGTLLESWIVNDSRTLMGNGISYYVSRLKQSKYITPVYSEILEDDAVANFFKSLPIDGSDSDTKPEAIEILFKKTAIEQAFTSVANYGDAGIHASVIADRRKTPFRMILVPGYNDGSNSVGNAMAGFISANKGLVYAVGQVTAFLTTEAEMYASGQPQIAVNVSTDDFIASRGFPYTQSYRVFDTFTRKNVILPISARAVLTIAQTQPWEIPAGSRRGKVEALKVIPELSDEALGKLYTKAKVNCVDKQPDGYYIWGQRTGQATPSARDRIHCVRTLVDIETSLEGLRQFVFERATPATIEDVVSFMENLRSYYRTGDKVLAFNYVIDLNNLIYNQLDVSVSVIVPESIEYVNITVNVDRDRGAVFLESLLNQ